jgi:thymidylate kinase
MNEKIRKIVFTGGPCSGKTTILKYVNEFFSKQGFKVVVFSETATDIICSGIHWRNKNVNIEIFQEAIFKLQQSKEDIFHHVMETTDYNNVLFLYDRGLMDGKAYINPEMFTRIYQRNGFLSEDQILSKYDLVIHLETIANKYINLYNLHSNKARTATHNEAKAFDNGVKLAWNGHQHHIVIPATENFQEKKNKVVEEMLSYINFDKKRY